ncbi:MAG: M48 family peptidase, partial [Calditrichaeota bacterium]|nr:M48 family peptidase [Calditrichota bacterium]
MIEFNAYLIFILTVIIGGYLLDLIVEYLNLKHLSPKLPSEFKDFYDEEKYSKSQDYTRTRTCFGFITGTFNLLLLLGFMLAGGFNYVDQLARSIGWGMIPTGLMFGVILSLGSKLIHLPFSIYSTFVIEEKYGFNKTTARTYVVDQIKGTLLSIIIGAPIFAMILWFFAEMGGLAWVYIWSALTAFQIVMMFIAPVLIMP